MIDINEVIKSLSDKDVIDIVSSLGGDNYEEKEKEIIFPTICHHIHEENASHKLYYYKNTKLFVCYTCCGTFNISGLLARRYELLGQDYDFYKDIVLPLAQKANFKTTQKTFDFIQPYDLDLSIYQKKKVEINFKHLNSNILNVYSSHCAAEWLEDNISEEAMRRYGIKYSIEENKVIIPHYDIDGYLIGIRGRTLNPDEAATEGKYRPIVFKEKVLSHPLGYNLYGLNFVKENIKRIGMAIVGEGENSPVPIFPFISGVTNVANGQLRRESKVVRESKS